MDSAAFSAGLSGAVAIVVAALTTGSTHLLTKKREREAEWRKMKVDLYKEYISALSRQMNNLQAAQTVYLDAIIVLALVAPLNVLKASISSLTNYLGLVQELPKNSFARC